MEVTIKDIAKRTGVSYATVSRALNGRAGVNEVTRIRVLEEAKLIGYQPNAIARGLVMGQTRTIGLVIPDITNPFFPEIASSVEDIASEMGYNIFLCNTDWDIKKEQDNLKALQGKRVDGIILKPVSDLNEDFSCNITVPIVLFNRIPQEGNYSCVEVDNVRGGFLATKHLIEGGYKQIAFIGGKLDSYSNRQRQEGYMLALERYKIKVDENLIINGSFRTRSGYEIMEKLMESDHMPDAVFAGNDIIALGVLQCVQENGLNVPQDFGVVGFDDIPFANLPQIQLTTIVQPKYQMGKYAIEFLIKEIEDKENSNREVKRIILEPELVIRKTTRNTIL